MKAKNAPHILPDGTIELEDWLEHLQIVHFKSENIRLVRNACLLAQLAGDDKPSELGNSCLQQGLSIAENVSDLDMDQATLAASIVYPSFEYAELSLEDIEEHLGHEVRKLVEGVQRMGAVNHFRQHHARKSAQLDNVRKMLLAMVDDVRVVLIKLAERLQLLRGLKSYLPNMQKLIARETIEIYAPLANRLGIGQMKWEMEDLAFRYIDPKQYKTIAKGLNSKRVERDKFVAKIVNRLETALEKNNIHHFKVYGRSKHIHSIHRKMQRKNIDLDKIYDATAVRVLVENEEECYRTLSIVHTLWIAIPEEFDDYIAKPKSNGYRSLHTAVYDESNKIFEIQIRTFNIHQEAELGIAAHWIYKEGGKLKQVSQKRKIEWLRQVLDWQKELTANSNYAQLIEPNDLDDRVYVFTPSGDILDLQIGATVLDFAYLIHSEIGHRCRGAKINGHIVSLNTTLNTGDLIEILTNKQGSPSRDWLNSHLGYLKTTRARAKVHHWFKQQDFQENADHGREILDREITKLRLHNVDQEKLAKTFNYKSTDDFFVALGRGDLRRSQLIAKLSPPKEKTVINLDVDHDTKEKSNASFDVYVQGVSNLMTHIARCCHPIPGEAIVGYITLGRGISIHKRDCNNIAHAEAEQFKRLIEVEWGERPKERYLVEILVEAYDRTGLLHDITSLLSQENISLQGLTTRTDPNNYMAKIELSLEVFNLVSLSKIIDKLTLIKNVTKVQRL